MFGEVINISTPVTSSSFKIKIKPYYVFSEADGLDGKGAT